MIYGMVALAVAFAVSTIMAWGYRRSAHDWRDVYYQANAELMAAEARSRGVGGTGEHAGYTVRDLGPIKPVVIGAIETGVS